MHVELRSTTIVSFTLIYFIFADLVLSFVLIYRCAFEVQRTRPRCQVKPNSPINSLCLQSPHFWAKHSSSSCQNLPTTMHNCNSSHTATSNPPVPQTTLPSYHHPSRASNHKAAKQKPLWSVRATSGSASSPTTLEMKISREASRSWWSTKVVVGPSIRI